MNSQEFQALCGDLKEKYDEKLLTDHDVDAFADVISNVLGRDDLRAEGTEYAALSELICGRYEADIEMTPLLARMYELCRMYEHFRARPLTELERKEIEKATDAKKQKRPAIFTIWNSGKPTANCWFEDLEDVAGIADKAAQITDALARTAEDDPVKKAVLCFAAADAGFDALDEEGASSCGLDDVPYAESRADGIICVNGGQERNRARKGADVKIDTDNKLIRLDCHTIYGIPFYCELTGRDDFNTDGLDTLSDEMIEFPFDQAEDVATQWKNISEPFKIPGSDKLIGVKKPVPLK